MNKFFAIAALVSATAFSSANARDTASAGRSYDNVDVVRMNDHADMGGFNEKITPDRATEQEAQGQLRKDPALRQALLRHDVELKNVMAIDSSGNGETIVYVR